ncbi:MAG: hypothetical protein IPM76_20595 [Chloroflexi bacterium]|nr:hypothetical protein [Chloroflexota bacterium]
MTVADGTPEAAAAERVLTRPGHGCGAHVDAGYQRADVAHERGVKIPMMKWTGTQMVSTGL